MTEEEIARYCSGKLLLEPEGLFALSAKVIPKEVCYMLEKALKIKEVYFIGISSDNQQLGILSILRKEKGYPEKTEVIEIIMNEASQAIQKYYALQSAIQNKERLQSLLDISQFKANSIQELLDKTLDEIVKLTNSEAGYIYLYNELSKELKLSTWSKEAIGKMSTTTSSEISHFKDTGICEEVIRKRKPIIINDLKISKDNPSLYHKEYAILKKQLSIPVFVDEKIVAIVGVGNKETDYEISDVNQITLMMDSILKIINEKEINLKIIENEEKYKALMEQSSDHILLIDIDTLEILEGNKSICDFLGFDYEDLIKLKIHDTAVYSKETLKDLTEKIRKDRKIYIGEGNYKRKNGDISIVESNASIIKYHDKEIICIISRDITDIKKIESFKNNFINRISHEMRIPLTAIKESNVILSDFFSKNLLNE